MSRAAIAEHANVNVAEALSNFAEGYAQATAALAEANAELANCADREIRSQLQGIASELHAMLQQGVFAISPNAIRELVGELKNVKAKAEGATGADNSPQAQLRRAEAAYREANERYKSDLERARDVGLISDAEYREHTEKLDQLNNQLASAQTTQEREAIRGQIAHETRDMERKVEEERQHRERLGTLTPEQAAAADAVISSGADVRDTLDNWGNLETRKAERPQTQAQSTGRFEIAEADPCVSPSHNAPIAREASISRVQI